MLAASWLAKLLLGHSLMGWIRVFGPFLAGKCVTYSDPLTHTTAYLTNSWSPLGQGVLGLKLADQSIIPLLLQHWPDR